MSAAAVDDKSRQDNDEHYCGGERRPLIFAWPWVGPSAVVAAFSTVRLVSKQAPMICLA
jgi:hypothetical protein